MTTLHLREYLGVAVVLLGAERALSMPAGETGIVHLRVSQRSADPVSGEFVIRRGGEPKITRSLPVRPGVDIQFSEAAGSTWQFEFHSDRLWAATFDVTLPAGEITKEITVWPTGRLTGKVQLAGEAKQLGLETVYVSVETPPNAPRAGDIPAGTLFECPVDTKGVFTCVVPATTLDIAVGAKGYAPHYRWDVRVQAGRARDLQTVTLKRGASLLVWLSRDAVKQLKAPATARLYRSAASNVAAPRFAAAVAEAKSDSRGAFHLSGIAPDVYTLVVTADGWAPTGVHPVEIRDGASVVLRRAIELERPFALQLQLQPFIEGADWTVEVRRVPTLNEGPSPGAPVRAKPDTAGMIVVSDMSPGTYRVVVDDANGNTLAASMLQIHGAHDAFQTIDVGGRVMHGRVTLGDNPLKAKLIFGGRSGVVRMNAQSKEDGSYEVFLPQREKWQVDIAAETPAMQTTMHVAMPETGNVLDIKVSTASIAGRVLLNGEPVRGATIRMFTGSATVPVQTDALGSFTFASVPSGKVGLLATTGRAQSRRLDLTLRDGEHRDGVVLELEPNRKLRLQLLAGSVPIGGARVTLLVPDGPSWRWTSVSSDLDGWCDATIPIRADRIRLFVAVPGLSFQPLEVAVREEPTMVVRVPAEIGGTVRIVGRPKQSHTLSFGNIEIPLGELARWIVEHGGTFTPPTLVAPNVASGVYRACTIGDQVPVCREGTLATGGTLTLDLTK